MALIRVGGCDFLTKFYYAWRAGAHGVVLFHDETVGPDDDSTLVNIEWEEAWLIPLTGLFISRYRGERLLAAHDAGHEVVAVMMMNPDVVAAEPPAEARPFALSVTPNPTRGDAEVWVEATRPVEGRLSVYDAVGREVAVLHAGPLPSGSSVYRLSGAGLPSGVYLVRLVAGEAVAVSRVVLLR